MTGEKLYLFDMRLCQHDHGNIRCDTDKPAFAAFVEKQLNRAAWKYLIALDGDDTVLGCSTATISTICWRSLRAGSTGRGWRTSHCIAETSTASARSVSLWRGLRRGVGTGFGKDHTQARGPAPHPFERRHPGRSRMGGRSRPPATAAMGALEVPATPKAPSRLWPARSHRHGTTAGRDQPGPRCEDPLMAAIVETQALHEVRDLLVSQRTVKEFYDGGRG